MTTPYPRSGTASDTLRSPKEHRPTHQVGRPQRILYSCQRAAPLSLLAQLDRYIERLASRTGGKANRDDCPPRARALARRNEAVGLRVLAHPAG